MGLTGHVTFNLAANNGFTKGEMKLGDVSGINAPKTTDFDSFRLYNSAPESFPALMEDTEEGTLASVELPAPLLISRQ